MKIRVGFPEKDRLLKGTLRAVTPEYGWLPAQKGMGDGIPQERYLMVPKPHKHCLHRRG